MDNIFYFNDNWKNIGIQLSGGADSAIMYYAVCNYYKNRNDVNIYPMTLDTEWKSWYSTGAKKVIERVTELTGKSPTYHIVNYSNKHNSKHSAHEYVNEQFLMIDESVKKFNLDAVYNGLTSNPHELDILSEMKNYYINDAKKFKIAHDHIVLRDKGRDLINHKKLNFEEKSILNKILTIVRPFVDKDKKIVYEAYKHYNMLEKLYPHTFSCETRNQNFVHCGHCFFCCERIYAFGKLI